MIGVPFPSRSDLHLLNLELHLNPSIHQECLREISKKLNVSKIRSLGTIAAFDLTDVSKDYGSSESNSLKKKFLEEGLLIRPLGKTIYLMPPYCISETCLFDSYKKIIKILS